MLTARARLSIARDVIAGLLSRAGISIRKNPVYVQFAVTKRCNLACRMCGAPRARAREKELSPGEIRKLAAVLQRLGTGVLVITGGEPLLREDLEEIIPIFTQRGIQARIQTNAVLATPERVKSLAAAGLGEVTVSLDTLDEKKQDRICNMEGAWKKIIAGMAAFSQILPPENSLLGMNTVVSKQNLDEIPELVEFATRAGYYISLIPVHVAADSSSFIVRKQSPEFEFTREAHPGIDTMYGKIIRMKKDGYSVFNSYRFLRESPDFLKSGRVHWTCESPEVYFAISPSGTFQPCVDINGTKSMLDDDFETEYRSGALKQQVREQVRKCPGCFYACWPEVTYACNDPGVILEKIVQDIRIKFRKRKQVSEQELLKLAGELKH